MSKCDVVSILQISHRRFGTSSHGLKSPLFCVLTSNFRKNVSIRGELTLCHQTSKCNIVSTSPVTLVSPLICEFVSPSQVTFVPTSKYCKNILCNQTPNNAEPNATSHNKFVFRLRFTVDSVTMPIDGCHGPVITAVTVG